MGYEREWTHTIFHLEDQVCDWTFEEMLTHCTDRAIKERSRVGFPQTFELAERRIYWVDSYNIAYCPRVSSLDEEITEVATIGQQYQEAVQFMLLTKADVEMMT